MGKLTDILSAADADALRRAWAATEMAAELAPLPAGDYIARVVGGEFESSRSNGTPGYKLTFRVLEGNHSGRQFWHDLWLTPAALPMTMRDLAKLGITDVDQLDRPLPPGIRCRVRVTVRKNDLGHEFNRVQQFEVVGIDQPEADPFAPSADDAAGEEGKTDA